MRSIYPDKVQSFIKENVAGASNKELSEMIKEKFGILYTEKQLKYYKQHHKLKSGKKRNKQESTKLFPTEVREFIKKNVKGTSISSLTEMVNQTFNKNYDQQQIKRFKATNHLTSGLDCRFKKGEKPHYTPPKGYHTKGSEKGWFKKGDLPSNTRPVGSERYNSDYGYIMVKTEHPNKWEPKHKVIWTKHYGEVPEGYKVMFLDGDTTNVCIKNLEIVKSDELLMANRKRLIFKDPEVTKTGVMISKLIAQANRMGKEKHQKV